MARWKCRRSRGRGRGRGLSLVLESGSIIPSGGRWQPLEERPRVAQERVHLKDTREIRSNDVKDSYLVSYCEAIA